MRLYWTTTGELARTNPEIFVHNLKSEGMFIGTPGTLIFRSKKEALEGIEKAKKWLQEQEEKRWQENASIADNEQ